MTDEQKVKANLTLAYTIAALLGVAVIGMVAKDWYELPKKASETEDRSIRNESAILKIQEEMSTALILLNRIDEKITNIEKLR